MLVKKVVVCDVFDENSYFYIDKETNSGFLIDPGAEANKLYSIIKNNNWNIESILITHGHFDHISAVEELSNILNINYFIHTKGEKYLKDTHFNLSQYCGKNITLNNAKYFNDGDFISLNSNKNIKLQVIHTPGHTLDSVIFYDKNQNIAFVGDTIFKDSIGNTSYPGGNHQELMSSITNKIFTLPLKTILYSGHTDKTTVEIEKNKYE